MMLRGLAVVCRGWRWCWAVVQRHLDYRPS
jgi:hypothetical protein